MAIDRTAFNLLVDDDGTNTTGSPWNKAAIASVILDPVDVALASTWHTVPFNVANFWSGLTAPCVGLNCYSIQGKTMFWMLQIVGAIPPTPASPYLYCILPAGATLYNGTGLMASVAYASDGPSGIIPAMASAGNAQTMAIQKLNATNWIGPCYAYVTATIALA